MSRRIRSLGVFAALSLGLALWAPSEARACGGGGFYPVTAGESVATTGHRVVISISKTQSVLWDQMQYQGDPADFAWVYPAKPGAHIEVATNGFVAALDAFTTKAIQSPTVDCEEPGGSIESGPSCGCLGGAGADKGGLDSNGRGGDQDTSVTVKSSVTIGPYDTQTVSSAVPGAIAQWLTDNNYKVPDEVVPVLDDYAANGYDFITMRLSPDKGVDQMVPVRVVTPGMNTTFPMRMLTAGATDHMALDVIILSEGRVGVDGFAAAEIDSTEVVWDFDKDTSSYADVRAQKLAADPAGVFLTSYSAGNAAFGTEVGGEVAELSLAALYAQTITASGEGKDCDTALFSSLGNTGNSLSTHEIVDACDDQGNCTDPTPSQIDSRDLECGAAKDLAVALVGMHPKDVWITRLEADLPKAALVKDLVITPNDAGVVTRILTASTSTGDACADGAAALATSGPAPKAPLLPPSAVAMIGAGLAAIAAFARRKLGQRATLMSA